MTMSQAESRRWLAYTLYPHRNNCGRLDPHRGNCGRLENAQVARAIPGVSAHSNLPVYVEAAARGKGRSWRDGAAAPSQDSTATGRWLTPSALTPARGIWTPWRRRRGQPGNLGGIGSACRFSKLVAKSGRSREPSALNA